MSLYLLRHEKRFPIPTFFTSLTEEGLENSIHLAKKIHDIQPDIIISSPFLRCIQTIYPYANLYNKKINIDYSLYEFLEDPLFTEKNYKHKYTELYKEHPEFKNIIHEEYQSHITINHISYPENTFDKLNKRLLPFVEYLRQLYSNTNIKILIVSHMSIVGSIKHYLQTGEPAKNDHFFPMGHLEHIQL